MRTPLRPLAAAALLLGAPLIAVAEEGLLWELSARVEMPGMPIAIPPITQTVCLAKELSAENLVLPDPSCKLQEQGRSGNKTSFTIACGGEAGFSGSGEIEHDGDDYRGRVHISVGGGAQGGAQMDQTFSAHRLGGCSNPVSPAAALAAPGVAR